MLALLFSRLLACQGLALLHQLVQLLCAGLELGLLPQIRLRVSLDQLLQSGAITNELPMCGLNQHVKLVGVSITLLLDRLIPCFHLSALLCQFCRLLLIVGLHLIARNQVRLLYLEGLAVNLDFKLRLRLLFLLRIGVFALRSTLILAFLLGLVVASGITALRFLLLAFTHTCKQAQGSLIAAVIARCVVSELVFTLAHGHSHKKSPLRGFDGFPAVSGWPVPGSRTGEDCYVVAGLNRASETCVVVDGRMRLRGHDSAQQPNPMDQRSE
ncbi:hypothetical protein A9K70_01270 [Stenotrophomonas maltophilia]|nr:hypothetical protein A9K70_01270 [Stenotrophomonas maltophilia]